MNSKIKMGIYELDMLNQQAAYILEYWLAGEEHHTCRMNQCGRDPKCPIGLSRKWLKDFKASQKNS